MHVTIIITNMFATIWQQYNLGFSTIYISRLWIHTYCIHQPSSSVSFHYIIPIYHIFIPPKPSMHPNITPVDVHIMKCC